MTEEALLANKDLFSLSYKFQEAGYLLSSNYGQLYLRVIGLINPLITVLGLREESSFRLEVGSGEQKSTSAEKAMTPPSPRSHYLPVT